MDAVATKASLDVKHLELKFDGRVINPNQTPQDLDMEDDDLIDARVTKK